MTRYIKKIIIFIVIVCGLCGCNQNNSIRTNYDIIKSFGEKTDNNNIFNKFNIIDLSLNKENYKVAIMQGKDAVQDIHIYKQNNNSFYELYYDYRGYTQSYVVYLKKENKTIVIKSGIEDCSSLTICWDDYQEKHELYEDEECSAMIFDNTNKIKGIIDNNSNDVMQYFLEITV